MQRSTPFGEITASPTPTQPQFCRGLFFVVHRPARAHETAGPRGLNLVCPEGLADCWCVRPAAERTSRPNAGHCGACGSLARNPKCGVCRSLTAAEDIPRNAEDWNAADFSSVPFTPDDWSNLSAAIGLLRKTAGGAADAADHTVAVLVNQMADRLVVTRRKVQARLIARAESGR